MNESFLPSPENEPQETPRRGHSVRAASILCAAVILIAGLAVRGFFHRSSQGGDMSCTVSESFEDIRIETVSGDVNFSVGGTDTCIVEYHGPSRMKCTAQVKNGTLVIEEKSAGRWPWNWSLFGTHSGRLTVFLPQRPYGALSAETVSGDIELPSGIAFRSLSFAAVSGDISLAGAETGSLTAETVSGNTEIRGGSVSSLSVSTTSGDQTVTSVTVAGRAELSTVSGSIAVLASDAESLEISTISGDVNTELLTPKDYITSTTSGEVSVIPSQPGSGRCGISTVSGNIVCR